MLLKRRNTNLDKCLKRILQAIQRCFSFSYINILGGYDTFDCRNREAEYVWIVK